MKLEKFNEKEFYEKYIKKDVLEASDIKELNKFVNGFLAGTYFLPFLSAGLFSFIDITNLTFILFIIFLSFSIFFFLLGVNSIRKLIKRNKELNLFKDPKYFKTYLLTSVSLFFGVIIFFILIDLTYLFFNFQLFMMVNILCLLFIYLPLITIMYEKINRETLFGIGYFIFKKEKEQKELEKEKKEEIAGIGSRKIDSDEIDDSF